MESLQTFNNEEIECNEDDLKVQEKVNLRRETRRRKILENAKNRLERLNGRTSSINASTTTTAGDMHDAYHSHKYFNGPTHLDGAEFSDPEVEPDITPQEFLQKEPPLDMDSLFSSLTTETSSTPQKRHILLRARLHLVISALISCVLTFVLYESVTSFSIFIPAGLCVVIDLLFFREQQPLNPVINLVITMCNIRLPSQTKNILHLLSIIQSLIVDLGVFIFSFCIFSCCLVYIYNRFANLIVIK